MYHVHWGKEALSPVLRKTVSINLHTTVNMGRTFSYSAVRDCFSGCEEECAKDNLVFRIVDSSMQTSHLGRGVLLAQSSSNPIQEGTICGEEMSVETAGRICNYLGFNCLQELTTGSFQDFQQGKMQEPTNQNSLFRSSDWLSVNQGPVFPDLVGSWYNVQTFSGLPIVASGVVCDSSSMSQCTFEAGPGRCSHQQDVHLSCGESYYNSPHHTTECSIASKSNFVSVANTPSSKVYHPLIIIRNFPTLPWTNSSALLTFAANICVSKDKGTKIMASLHQPADLTLSINGSGLLVVNYFDTSEMANIKGTVCRNGMTMSTAHIICKKMGYTCAKRVYSLQNPATDQTFEGSISYNGGTNITFEHNGQPTEILINFDPVRIDKLHIYGVSGTMEIAEVTAYSAKFNDTCDTTFSLVNKAGNPSHTGYGLLKAHWMKEHNLKAELVEGTVCDDGFTQEAADAICMSMGYECANYWQNGESERYDESESECRANTQVIHSECRVNAEWFQSEYAANTQWKVQYLLKIVMFDVFCRGENPDISNCTFDTQRMNCAHDEDVFISCDKRYDSLGCWDDGDNQAAIPSLEGSFPYSNRSWVERPDPIAACRRAAESKGYSVFAIQNGGWCTGSPTAQNTYRKYGVADNCREDGTGGFYSNNVYEITRTELRSLGCWKDDYHRAIPSLEFTDRPAELSDDHYMRYDPIEDCKNIAEKRGYKVFALTRNGQCLGGPDAWENYNANGRSDKCSDNGLGAFGAYEAYKIREGKCGERKSSYRFTLMDENWNKNVKSGLLLLSSTEGTVCDDMFNRTAAQVICKEMGFKCVTGWGTFNWDDVQNKFPIVLDDVECGAENITFSECGFKTTTNCVHNEDIHLSCNMHCKEPTYKFRLVNVETGEEADDGILLATLNDTTTIIEGTVCDDIFEMDTANVICREMSYKCARNFYTVGGSSEFQEDKLIVLDNVLCTAGSDHFSQETCSFVMGHNCDHMEDVFLSCKKTQEECDRKEGIEFYLADIDTGERTTGLSGILFANRTDAKKLGTVCDDGFGTDTADIICQELGFKASVTWTTAEGQPWMENFTAVLDDVQCSNNATSFSDCSYVTYHDCSYYENVYLVCSTRVINDGLSFYVVDEHGKQIVNGLGLLIAHRLKTDGGPVTGVVCSPGFNSMTASVVCKQMGYTSAVKYENGSHMWGVQRVYPSLVTNFTCTDPANMSHCTFDYEFNCEHPNNIFIECTTSTHMRYICPEGAHQVNEKCEPCPRNTYKDGGFSDGSCKDCPEGWASDPGSSKCRRCLEPITNGYCPCPHGSVFNVAHGCTPCPTGTYHVDFRCEDCPDDADSEPGSTTCDCGTAAVWNKDTGLCEVCEDGSVNVDEVCTVCELGVEMGRCKCAKGMGWDFGTQSCEECSEGEYVTDSGCSQCPDFMIPTEDKTYCVYCADNEYWNSGVCTKCKSGEIGRFDNCVESAKLTSTSDASWRIPAIIAGILCFICIALTLLSVRLRRQVGLLKKRGQIEVEELGAFGAYEAERAGKAHCGGTRNVPNQEVVVPPILLLIRDLPLEL
eukprot:sb/3479325/